VDVWGPVSSLYVFSSVSLRGTARWVLGGDSSLLPSLWPLPGRYRSC